MHEVLLDQPVEWLAGGGPDSDVALHSHGALARNVAGYPFVQKCTEFELRAIEERILGILESEDTSARERYYSFDGLSSLAQRCLVERGLASEALIEAAGPRGVLVAENQSASISINGGEHIVLQALTPGLQPQEVWQQLGAMESVLLNPLDAAFDETYGFLTASLELLGTGLSLEVLLHLPALAMTGRLMKVEREARSMRQRLEGAFGPVSEGPGDLYYLKNAATLGVSEEEIVFHLRHAAAAIIGQERLARRTLLDEGRTSLEDRVGRALGLARGARLLEFEEALAILSSLRLGAVAGLLEHIEPKMLNEMLLLSHPAHIQMKLGGEVDALRQSIERAELFRSRLA